MIRIFAAALAACLALVGCGQSSTGDSSSASPASTPTQATAAQAPLSGTINVYAAASLTKTFTELGDRLMA